MFCNWDRDDFGTSYDSIGREVQTLVASLIGLMVTQIYAIQCTGGVGVAWFWFVAGLNKSTEAVLAVLGIIEKSLM